ncbi:hypothetical protein N8Z07_02460, partial [Pelagibacteraceae bacterium]|nr:hypothetical protein [Pelagibacteraceae bacterium]
MIKKLIKITSIIFLLVFLLVFYLSFVGIKTEKFNEKITNRILKINKNIKLDLKDIKFLINPYNFTANITTKDPTILLGDDELQIKNIKTNISLKALIFDKFSLDELQIITKPILLKDIILLIRSFKNSPELFLLDNIIKDGFLIADIKLKFDEKGNLKEDYQINGFIKNAKFNLLNKLDGNNLNLNFDVNQNKYSLIDINTEINDIKLSSPLIEVNKKKDIFFIKGKILTKKQKFSLDQLSMIFTSLSKHQKNLEKIRFSSENDISFNISEKLKFKDLNIESKI